MPVVVIGGGLTGCATAHALAESGVGVVLVEAGRLGVQGTGRASGLISGDAAPSYLAFEKAHGRRVARAVFEATRQAVRDLASTAKRLGIKPALDIHDGLQVARQQGQEKALLRELAARQRAGLEGSWVKPQAVLRETGLDAPGGLRTRGWAHADPYRLTVGFAAAAAKRKAAIFEASPVRALRTGDDHIDVVLPGGMIHAGTVIVCTGEPGSLHSPLARHFKLDERYVVATEPVPAGMRRAFGRGRVPLMDAETPPHAIAWTADGRLVVSGGDQPRTSANAREKVWVQRTGQLMYEVLRMHPEIAGLKPAYGWDVPVARSSDDVMLVGPHRNFPRQLFAWGGSPSPSHAFLASRILVRYVLGREDKTDRLFALTRSRS